MIDLPFFTKLHSAVDHLSTLLENPAVQVEEDHVKFSLAFEPELQPLDGILSTFSPYTGFLALKLTFRIHQGTGSADLTTGDEFVVDSWDTDPNLNLSALSLAGEASFQNLANQLSVQDARLNLHDFTRQVTALAAESAKISFTISLFLDKQQIIQAIAPPQNVRLVLFLLAGQFRELLKGFDLAQISHLFAPAQQDTLIMLFGDVRGAGQGPNLRILGRDRWSRFEDLGFVASPADCKKLQDSRRFNRDESSWEPSSPALTPFHLRLDTSDLNNAELVNVLTGLQNHLCAAYLANRCTILDRELTCDFLGYKRVEIKTPLLTSEPAAEDLYRLYEWAYDSSSSDKLEMVRQLITLQLNLPPAQNYNQLAGSSRDILRTAKGNYKLYLKRSVELYFDKRLRVSEFLQTFSEAISKSVSDLTSSLINDLYKTLGVIVGAVITIALDPKYTQQIITLVAFLYFIYIAFILLYLLPSAGWRYRNNVLEYEKNVSQLSEILTKEEITNLEHDSFKRVRVMFRTTYLITYLIYAVLAVLGFCFFALGFLIILLKP